MEAEKTEKTEKIEKRMITIDKNIFLLELVERLEIYPYKIKVGSKITQIIFEDCEYKILNSFLKQNNINL
jgi:hypothetical protein